MRKVRRNVGYSDVWLGKILKKFNLIIISIFLVSAQQGLSSSEGGSTPEEKKREIVNETGGTALPVSSTTSSYNKNYTTIKPEYVPSASPGITVGYTFYDYQGNYRLNKQVWVDKYGRTSVAWMKTWDPCGIEDCGRSVYYNWRDLNGVLLNSQGIQVTINEFKWGGYCGVTGLSDGRSVLFFHEIIALPWDPTGTGTFVAIDKVPGFGDFGELKCDTRQSAPFNCEIAGDSGRSVYMFDNPPDSFFVDTLTNDTTFLCQVGIWSSGHVDLLDRVHIIAQEGNSPCSLYRVVYTRSLDSSANSWTPPQLLDSVISIPSVVAVSFDPDTIPYDDTGCVALVWVSPKTWSGCLFEQEIYYRKSTDGGTTFGPETQFTDHTGLPFRPYGDISAIIDNSGTLHVVYTGIETDMINCIQDDQNSYIVHIAEGQGQTIITEGLWPDTKPGLTATNVCKPSIGMAHSYTDPSRTDEKGIIEGRLYCTWVQFNPGDRAASGMSNGEIYGSYSKTNGNFWSTPANLTNSPTPGCIEIPKVPSSDNTGTCDSDHWQSLADLVLNDTLSIFYINDKVAGRFDEGLETNNPVKLLRFDVNLIENCVGAMVADLNLDSTRSPSDLIIMINHIFKRQPLPPETNICAADLNRDWKVSPADLVFLINHLFKSHSLPYETCGCFFRL